MARRFRSFRRGARKPTDWSASGVLGAPVAIPGNGVNLLEVFTPIVGGETVVRTRGMFGWMTDQVVSDEFQFGAFGLAVVTAQAVSVGITAVPHPATDAAWGGWFYHSYFASAVEFISADGVNTELMHTQIIDSKAMRKVDEDERIIAVVENMSSFGLEFINFERFLSKVH